MVQSRLSLVQHALWASKSPNNHTYGIKKCSATGRFLYGKLVVMKWAKQKDGFTIVELLIVIVVIAILAAITIVAFSGVSQRATSSALQSEVSQATKKIESIKVASGNDTYPANQAAAGLSSAVTYYYEPLNKTYCVEARESATEVYASTSVSQEPTAGSCGEQGLVGWWRLNNDTNDASGNGYNGTGNSVTSTIGQNGVANNAYGFLSASNSSIVVPNNAALSTEPQTFSFWVNPTSWTSATASAFISKRVGTSTGYFIAYLNASTSLIIDCGNGSGNRWTPGAASAPPLGQWTHVVITCSTATGLALYFNGTLVATRPTVDRSAINSSANLAFGRDTNLGSYTLDGSMDDVRLFNRVLTIEEIQAMTSVGAQ